MPDLLTRKTRRTFGGSSISRVALLVGAIALGSCANARDGGVEGPDKPGPSDPNNPVPAGTLTVTPADKVIAVDGKAGFQVQYRAVNKKGEDVTEQAVFSIDDERLGFFQLPRGLLQGRPGQLGKSMVRARVGEDAGSTTLAVRLETVIIAPGAPTDAPTKFGGGANARFVPEIAYPPPGALMPPNINELDIHFKPKDATLFEVSISGPTTDVKIYTPCTKINMVADACAFIPDEATMKLLAQTGRGQEMELKIRGASLDGTGGVGTSPGQPLRFSEEDMKGGIYYWAASVGGIARYDFGLRGKKPESYYGPLQALATCAGCHALSRNGKRIAAGLNIPGPALMRALDTATKTKLFEVGTGFILGGSNYQAFDPEGKWLVTTENGGLTLRDGTSGMLMSAQPAISQATMPDFSPDGKTIVYVKNSALCIPPLCPNLSSTKGSLFTVEFLGDKGFGTPKQILASMGENNYYPAISPDGKFVVFNQAGGDSYDAADARVMVMPIGGGTPIDLISANQQTGNSWPKWSPFLHRFKGQSIMWLTFSSRRLYGLRPTPAAQLWMIPVDAARLEKGMDSAYPPIRLPFQDLATGNHIAQWVAEVERQKCSLMDMPPKCGPLEVCMDGVCKPDIR